MLDIKQIEGEEAIIKQEKCKISWNQGGWFDITNQIPEFAKNTVWPMKVTLNTIEPKEVEGEGEYVLSFTFELHRVARIHPNIFEVKPLQLPTLQIKNKEIDNMLRLCYSLDAGFKLDWNNLIPVAVRPSYCAVNVGYDGATGEILQINKVLEGALETGKVLQTCMKKT